MEEPRVITIGDVNDSTVMYINKRNAFFARESKGNAHGTQRERSNPAKFQHYLLLICRLVAHKIFNSAGIIYRSSCCLSKTSLGTLYNYMVPPFLYYCSLVQGSTHKSNLKKVNNITKTGDTDSKQVRL